MQMRSDVRPLRKRYRSAADHPRRTAALSMRCARHLSPAGRAKLVTAPAPTLAAARPPVPPGRAGLRRVSGSFRSRLTGLPAGRRRPQMGGQAPCDPASSSASERPVDAGRPGDRVQRNLPGPSSITEPAGRPMSSASSTSRWLQASISASKYPPLSPLPSTNSRPVCGPSARQRLEAWYAHSIVAACNIAQSEYDFAGQALPPLS